MTVEITNFESLSALPNMNKFVKISFIIISVGVIATLFYESTAEDNSGGKIFFGDSEHQAPLGVYRGSGQVARIEEFERWLGREIGYILDFVGRTPRSVKAPWKGIDDPSDRCRPWANDQYRLVLSVAILPNDRFTLKRGANGAYDHHWKKFATALVNSGCENAILRLGWEFNGLFYPWSATGQEELYAGYWRRIVKAIRTIPNQKFSYDWSVLAGNNGADVETAYPGDDVVDFIGLDAYDTSTFTSEKDRRKDQRERIYGLDWHAAFAKKHQKPMTFPEWGLTVRRDDSLGGQDSPSYIESMLSWISSNNVAYAIYFDFDAEDASHRISSDRFPNSSNFFKKHAGDLAKQINK